MATAESVMPSASARRRLMFFFIGSPLANLLMDRLDWRSHCPDRRAGDGFIPVRATISQRRAAVRGGLYFVSLPVTRLFVTGNNIFPVRHSSVRLRVM